MAQIKTKKQTILHSALKLAGEYGWSNVHFEQIAKESKIQTKELTSIFTDKDSIFFAIFQEINDELSSADLQFDLEQDTEKDRLFEVIMYRFDLLNQNREAFISMLSPFTSDLEKAWKCKSDFCHSMRSTLEKADITPNSMMKEDALIVAISTVYLLTMKTWLEDKSEDMAKTMANLDKYLEKMFRFSSILDKFPIDLFNKKTVWSDG